MKASLLARAAPALLLTTILVGGAGTIAFAQTPPAAPAPATSTTPGGAAPGATPSGGATTAAPGTASTTHPTMAHHPRNTASRTPGETMQQMVEQRITDLHARMHITTAQQSQWDQFAQVMRDNAKELDQAYQQRAAQIQSMNAVENMQTFAQIEQTRAQGMQKLVQAFQTLYTSLSDQQKQQADQLFRNYAEHTQQHHAKTSH